VTSLSPLVGRVEELGLVEKLVQEHRLVTVTGAAGVGKTRLVEEICAERTAAGDRVISVRLDDVGPGADAAAIACEAGMASPEALALASAGERILVVLDGCDHVLAGATDLALRFCAATDTGVVLTTSRQPLGVPGERLVVLDPLAVPSPGDPDPTEAASVTLFLDLVAASDARWDRSDRTLQAVADLCRAVDGLPLAVELAAGRARTLSPQELLELVTGRTDSLRPPGGERPGQPAGIDAAIGLSVDLLDDDHRELFRRLGVLTGTFDLGLVRAVGGSVAEDHLRAVELVGGLVDRSLVVAAPSGRSTRYRMLQVVREHALADLTAAGRAEATRERLAAAMVAEATGILIEGSQRWSGDLIARITTRAASFVASLEWCIAHDDEPSRAYALYVPLFATAQQRASDVKAVGAALFRRWPDTPGPLRAEALAVSATAHVLSYDLDAAGERAAAALTDPDGTPIATVLAERVLTLAAIGRDDPGAALDHARKGAAVAAAVPLPPFERELRGFEAALVDRRGDPGAADLAAAVIADSRAADDPLTEIWARLVAATIDIRDGRIDDARAQIDQAQRRSAAIDDAWWGGPIARSRALLAAHGPAEDGWRASRSQWRAAIERCARLGDLPELTLTLSTAAAAAEAHGHPTDARALLRASPHLPALTVLPEVYAHRVRHAPPDLEGAEALVPAVRQALAVLAEPPADQAGDEPEPPPAAEGARLAREGDVWAVTYAGRTVRVRDLKGIGDLAALLRRGGEEVHCLELMGAVDVGDAGPALDEQARRTYQARILELQREVDDAREANDPGRAERSELELDALVTELSRAFGLSGRSRGAGSSVERARTAVTFRIRAAIKRIAEQHEPLGTHLSHSVRTGTWCAYRPERAVRWVVEGP
jgi:predicted ATPase